MTIADFQRLIEAIYLAKDRARGMGGTFMWFSEEVGELARALREWDASSSLGAGREHLEGEFADVLAWLSTLASLAGVDLAEAAAAKYSGGCPKCRQVPCACPEEPAER